MAQDGAIRTVGTADKLDLTVGGIVLAAGTSARYGAENKLLTPLSGTPMVRQVAETAVESALASVVAIVGHEHESVAEVLAPTVDAVRYTDRYADGQSATVRHGVAIARRGDWDAILFILGDMPFIETATLDLLEHSYRSSAASIVVPRYEGQRGNPVLFSRRHFEQLANLSGDRGGREILLNHDGTRFVDVDDAGVVQDIDTERDKRVHTE